MCVWPLGSTVTKPQFKVIVTYSLQAGYLVCIIHLFHMAIMNPESKVSFQPDEWQNFDNGTLVFTCTKCHILSLFLAIWSKILFPFLKPAAQPCSNARTHEDSGPSTRPTKKAKVDNGSSDGYSSDTDVDDPDQQDMDTDEEDLLSLSPSKERRKNATKSQCAPSKTPVQALDSQELFNDSLEAELYPSRQKISPRKTAVNSKNNCQPQVSTTGRGKTPASVNSIGKPQEPKKGEDSASAVTDPSDSQKSIIEELF